MLTTQIINSICILTLNHPKNGNALSSLMTLCLLEKLHDIEQNDQISCVIITGNEKYFSAGADIIEMKDKSFVQMYQEDYFSLWNQFTNFKKPKIAAVSGLALGGGCELALMCDLIFASELASFGQPEIKLGVIPAIGGSQRLTNLIGKSHAMDLILTGRQIDANEAKEIGLVSRVIAPDELIKESLKVANQIASFSKNALVAAKECVDLALEVGLQDGIRFERRIFHSLFSTQDQKEGMNAFFEKRLPQFKHK